MTTLEGLAGLISPTSPNEPDVQSKHSADSILDKPETSEHTSKGTKRQRAKTRRLGLRSPNNTRSTPGHGEDPIYKETAPNARVFRTYNDESQIFDADMVEESRDTVDVLLVFTSQNLQVSYSQMSALLLFELVSVQRAIARGVPVDQVATSAITPSTPFTPATIDSWVNGLWFTSLSLSLTTALGAVLVKQWLHQYISLPSGTPRDRSRIRQYRYVGFEKWQVPIIIGLLPVLMHVALAIFFVGLFLFLFPLSRPIAVVVGTIAAAVYLAYVVTNILPLLYPQCPYKTPLSYLIQQAYTRSPIPALLILLTKSPATYSQFANASIQEAEHQAVKGMSHDLDVQSLHWLFTRSSNPTVRSIVVQAIGGLQIGSMESLKRVFDGSDISWEQDLLLHNCVAYDNEFSSTAWPMPGMERKIERLLRFELFFPRDNTSKDYLLLPESGPRELTAIVAGVMSNSAHRPSDCPTGIDFLRDSLANREDLRLHPIVWIGILKQASLEGDLTSVGGNIPFHMALCAGIIDQLPFESHVDEPVAGNPSATLSHVLRRYPDILPIAYKIFGEFDLYTGYSSYSLSDPVRLLLALVNYLLALPPYTADNDRHSASLTPLSGDHESLKARLFFFTSIIPHIDPSTIFPATSEYRPVLDTARRIVESDLFTLPADSSNFAGLWKARTAVIRIFAKLVGAYPMLGMVARPQKKILRDWFTLPRMKRILALLNHPAPYADAGSDYSDRDTYIDVVFKILETCFSYKVAVAFDAFIETGVIDFLGQNRCRYQCVDALVAYIARAPMTERRSSSDTIHLESSASKARVDYLYQPNNLFTAAVILAFNQSKWQDSIQSHREIKQNILALVQLRPNADAWASCRSRLLYLSRDAHYFATLQLPNFGQIVYAKPEEVQILKSNLQVALGALNEFFGSRDQDSGAGTIFGFKTQTALKRARRRSIHEQSI
ncbi:hypothetical protein IW261DRAFT_1417738 [Armillaria novae-zelandiae]|uniref:DUF6535 domain-containing protein n=1 Tax=Armillaria novae-zelandiae TaxID=153914 RepID=A0AA39PGU6_9AGAR|nr:hypothetical protein IW261DRAFT_1417738 [Armillaria novae-zelandiae]